MCKLYKWLAVLLASLLLLGTFSSVAEEEIPIEGLEEANQDEVLEFEGELCADEEETASDASDSLTTPADELEQVIEDEGSVIENDLVGNMLTRPAAGWYRLYNAGSGKFLNISYNSDENGNNIILWHEDGTTGQRFYLYYPGSVKGTNGQYTQNAFAVAFRPECSNGNPNGRVVNGAANTTVGNGTNVVLWNRTNHVTQTWYVDFVDNWYVIRNISNTNCVLTVAGNYDGANAYVANYDPNNSYQKWALLSENPVVTSIELSTTARTLEVGQNYTLSATAYPTNAQNRTIYWKTSNSSVATVSGNGVVTAKGAGTAQITAYTSNGVSRSAAITVKANSVVSVTSISLSTTNLYMKSGETNTLYATAYPTNAQKRTIYWKTSNSSVASVSSSGVVTAKNTGSATITAYTSNGVSKSISVYVITAFTQNTFKYFRSAANKNLYIKHFSNLLMHDKNFTLVKKKTASSLSIHDNGYCILYMGVDEIKSGKPLIHAKYGSGKFLGLVFQITSSGAYVIHCVKNYNLVLGVKKAKEKEKVVLVPYKAGDKKQMWYLE